MVVDERLRLLFPRILSFVAIAAVVGAGYGYETSIAVAAGLRGLIRGALTGALIGAAGSSFDAFILEAPRVRLVPASFMVTVAVRSLVYLMIPDRYRVRAIPGAQPSTSPAGKHLAR